MKSRGGSVYSTQVIGIGSSLFTNNPSITPDEGVELVAGNLFEHSIRKFS